MKILRSIFSGANILISASAGGLVYGCLFLSRAKDDFVFAASLGSFAIIYIALVLVDIFGVKES